MGTWNKIYISDMNNSNKTIKKYSIETCEEMYLYDPSKHLLCTHVDNDPLKQRSI